MDRLHALAVSDEELLSIVYSEGVLPEEQREHLEHCTICQQRLAEYRHTNTHLFSKLYRTLCPDAVQLNYYCLGILPEEERINIASHTLDCPLCTEEVEQTRRLQATFDPFPPLAFSLRAAVRHLFARPVMQHMQSVVRDISPSIGWSRQYSAESIELSLYLSHEVDGEIMLLGIVTSTDTAETIDAFKGAAVELYSASGPIVTERNGEQENKESVRPLLSTQIDEIGNILLEPLQAGEYVMVVRLPDQDVVIEGLIINHGS